MELVELEAEESLPLVARGGVELAIAEEYEHAPRPPLAGLERAYLEPDEMVLALPAEDPAAASDPVSLAALSDIAWATGHAGTAFSDMVTRICRAVSGFEPDVRYRVSDMDLLLGLVAGGRTAASCRRSAVPSASPAWRCGGSRGATSGGRCSSRRARATAPAPPTAAAVAAIEAAARTQPA